MVWFGRCLPAFGGRRSFYNPWFRQGLQAERDRRYSDLFAPFGLILPKVRAKGLFLPKSCRRSRAVRRRENVGKVNANCLQVVICQQFDRQQAKREN